MDSSDSSIQEQTGHVKLSQSNLTCITTSNTRSLKFFSEEIELVRHGVANIGSVIVCEVVSVGAHKYIEGLSGGISEEKYIILNPGDLIMGVMGHRDSTISMYGGLPASGIELPREEPVDLLSAGGVIGICDSWPTYRGSPTKLRVLGLASQQGKLLNVIPLFEDKQLKVSCPLILIAGTSAGVGKTKFASKLIYYISHDLGRHVAATKLAGAGDLGDLQKLCKAGAQDSIDFVDAGLVTTYGVPEELVVSVAKGILNHLNRRDPEVIIAELGGDIFGANIPAILTDPEIRDTTLAMILVPSDIVAAYGAFKYLKEERNFPAQVYFSQPLEKNPEASQRRARDFIECSRLYDCEIPKDLEDLVEEVLGWRGKMDDLTSQTEETRTAEEQGTGHPTSNAEIFQKSAMLEELSFSPLKSLSG